MKKNLILTSLLLASSMIFMLNLGCASTPAAETSDIPAEKKVERPKEDPKDPPNIKFVKQLQKKLDSGDTQGAIELFNNIPSSLKDDLELKQLLGALYISDNQYDNAISIAREILEKDPDNMDALELISYAQKLKGDKKAYKETSDKILSKDPYNAAANIQKAEDYALNKKYKLARESYKKALKGDSNNNDARFGFAQMSYYVGDIEAAKVSFNEILVREPENAAANAYLGKIYSEEENYLKATKYVTEALKYDPKNYDYWLDYGNYLRYQGKTQDAIKAWEKAVDLDPTYFLAYAYLAGVYDEHNEFDKALDNYLKVVETNPKYFYAYEEIAILAFHQKRYGDAVKYFEKAYTYSDSYAYKLMISACYTLGGDKLKAKNVLTPLLKTLSRDSVEYSMVRFYSDAFSKNAENTLISKISKEENSNKRGKMLFYMGLYYEINGHEDFAKDYYSKVTAMQAPMFFEYRIAEWGLGL